MIYLDTSVLLKRYCDELDSDEIRRLMFGAPSIATASFSYAEFFSGLHRKLRENAMDAAAYRSATIAFDEEWRRWTVVPLSNEVLQRARAMSERHGLRAGDAVQLGSAMALAVTLPVQFASADHSLTRAARAEGLPVR